MIAAVLQLTSSPDREKNWRQAERMLEEAAAKGAKLAVLPEYFGFTRVSGKDPLLSEPLQGPTFQFLSRLAASLSLWIVGGTFYREHASLPSGKFYNTCVIINEQGAMVGYYDKIHLATSSGGVRGVFSESKYLAHGDKQWVGNSPVGKLGVAVCYDLRFPEITRGLRVLGAQAVAAPSAFFVTPGERQWEAIIRTRAIEQQCYMLVAAQWGEFAPKRQALGFSMIVDPWGDVVAKCPPGVGMALAEIDPSLVEESRAGIDYLAQARMLPDKITIKTG